MIARQFPSPQIFGDLQSMPGAEVASQRLASEAAFEADHVVMLHRSSDRHRRGAGRRDFRRLSKPLERLLDRNDQRRELVRSQGMVAYIARDDLGYRPKIGVLFRIIGIHDWLSFRCTIFNSLSIHQTAIS